MLGLHGNQGRGGAYRLSSNQPFQRTLTTANYFKTQQSSFESSFQFINGISSDANTKRYDSFLQHKFNRLQELNKKLHSWQKGEAGTFMGLTSNSSKSDIFRIRLQNRNGFNIKFLQQDFQHFVTSEMAAESSFTGITEVNVTASATSPFFDVCRKLDRSSTLIQSYPLGNQLSRTPVII